MGKLVYLLFCSLSHFIGISFGQTGCTDSLMKDVCESYSKFGQCNTPTARTSCKKTCGVCGVGWTAWSVWGACSLLCGGQKSRTRTCNGVPTDCIGTDFQVDPCAPCPTGVSPTATTKPLVLGFGPGVTPGNVSAPAFCSSGLFDCEDTLDTCIETELVCDGYRDCPNGVDELLNNCVATFQIKNDFAQVCMEVITDDPSGPINGVKAYRRCPSDLNPQRSVFLWKWWRSFHLLNVKTGRCLETQNPLLVTTPELTTHQCDSSREHQKFVCDDRGTKGLLLRVRKYIEEDKKRYVSLGDDGLGWPPTLTNNDTGSEILWHRGPQEPPSTLCGDLQVYWSEWSTWSACSLTCRGGFRTHTRHCVNGFVGVSPCVGGKSDTNPCNGHIPCKAHGSLSPNSECRDSWISLNNSQIGLHTESLDPGCYKLLARSRMSYDDAKNECTRHRSFLAAIKEESASQLLIDLMNSSAVSDLVYIGIEENFYNAPMQGHHLRFNFDSTPVGSFSPWKIDCVLGPGFDYRGKVAETSSGITCQPWNVNSTHVVQYHPIDGDDHNYCRNPNLDPLGPWCYTVDENVEKEYCEIPFCLETDTPGKLGDSADFQIAQDCLLPDGVKGLIYIHSTGIPGISPQTVSKTACRPIDDIFFWSSIQDDRKFVWDAARSKIILSRDMLCLEAGSTQPEANVQFVDCKADKINQRWFAAQNMLFLNVFHFQKDLHLDMSISSRTLVVTTMDLSAWTVTRSAGHFVDWAKLRKVLAGQSFHLYSIKDKMCLGVNVTEDRDDPTSSDPFTYPTPILQSCEQSPGMRWIKLRGMFNTFLHLQTSLCLKMERIQPGSALVMAECSTVDNNQKFRCDENMFITSSTNNNLYLGSLNTSITLNELSGLPTKWKVWKSRNLMPCNIESPRPGVAVGSRFSIRNKFSKLCLHDEPGGNVVGETCQEMGNNTDEVWQFGENPTMIVHRPTGKCLHISQLTPAGVLQSQDCKFDEPRQHWTIFPRNHLFLNQDLDKFYYGLHLIENRKLVVTMNSIYKDVKLRDDTTRHWFAINRLGLTHSIESMTACVASSKETSYFYRGKVSHTITGKKCEMWAERERKLFPHLKENFCSNPGNQTRFPWCYTRDHSRTLIEERCFLPECPTAKIAVDKKGKWHAVTGQEELNIFCQAEPDCVRDIGTEYLGSWNITAVGVCVSWSDHISMGVAEHNFCRNPTGSPQGPWCYTTASRSVKQNCEIPDCHKTCRSAPEDLFHSETVHHEFAAAVYGMESASTAVTQCHRGYWLSSGTYRHTTTCADSEWQPEPSACKVITCPAILVTVPGATLSPSTNTLYDQTNSFVCDSKHLAGPGKITIDYRCNEVGQWEKVGNQEEECETACQETWDQLKGHCYKVVSNKVNYAEAKAGCEELNGTLADIEDKLEFNFLKHLVKTKDSAIHGQNTLYWLGIQHHYQTPVNSNPTWRDFRSVRAKTDDEVKQKKGVGYLPLLYKDFFIMHYMHNRHTQEFDNILAYDRRCMFIDAKYAFVGSRGCYDYPARKMLWRWVSPFHLYNVATDKCISGFPKNGRTKQDIRSAPRGNKCNIIKDVQLVGCRRHESHASLKILYQSGSFFVDDVVNPWDKIRVGGEYFAGNYTRWILNTSDYDICHHSVTIRGNVFLLWEGAVAKGNSYTYTEAEQKCTEQNARLATETELITYLTNDDISSCGCGWADGNVAFTVMSGEDHLCSASAPRGGVKQCSPTPAKADVWCFKDGKHSLMGIPWALALWLHNSSREGVHEKDPTDKAKYICKKQSRWFCADPPEISQAKLIESHFTSFSYLGRVSYECAEGYWFDPGRYAQTITCTSELDWEPDPYHLACRYLQCPEPTRILNADLPEVQGYHFGDKATYVCNTGFWFYKDVFEMEVTCSGNAEWTPSLLSLKCITVVCDPPEEVPFAQTAAFTYAHPFNATITCNDGYWVEPGVTTFTITCKPDGFWHPQPNDVFCWEVMCEAPPDVQHAVWGHEDLRTLVLSCEDGYRLMAKDSNMSEVHANISESVNLKCLNDGQWQPKSPEFYCAEVHCAPPPKVPYAESNASKWFKEYDYKSEIIYLCHAERHLLRIFAPYAPFYEYCFMEDSDNYVYASKEVCQTQKALHLQWTKMEHSDDLALRDINSGMCLGSKDPPTDAASYKRIVMSHCNESDPGQIWLCNMPGASDLVLGLQTSNQFYLTIDRNTKHLHTTSNSEHGLSVISFAERYLVTERDICHLSKHRISQTVTCSRNGKWVPDPLKIECSIMRCPDPPTVENARMEIISLSNEYYYGTAVQYTCFDGYELLKDRRKFVVSCTDMSTWVPDPANFGCNPVQCPPYEPPENTIVLFGDIESMTFGDQLIIACRIGWNFEKDLDAINVHCNEQGDWDASHHVNGCQIVVCDEPPNIMHAEMISTGIQFNGLARYTCDNGFWFEPGVTRKDAYCTQMASWLPDPMTFTCSRILCIDPGPIPRTYRYEVARPAEEFFLGSIIMYKCETGQWFAENLYKIAITCRDDAEWHPHPTTIVCLDMTCDKPSNLPLYSFLIGDDFSFGSSVTIQCEPGYRLGSNSIRATNSTDITCTKKQSWIPVYMHFKCLPITCKRPKNITNAIVYASDHLFESYAQYFCVEGYWIQPSLTSRLSQCTQHGQWYPDPSTFVCKVVDCGHPGTFYNAKPVKATSGTRFGASADIECITGYILLNQHKTTTTITCSKDGLWEPPPENIFCVALKCADPGAVENAERYIVTEKPLSEISFQDPSTGSMLYNFGVKIKYVCHEDLEFEGQTSSVVLTCSGDERWSTDPNDLECKDIVCTSPTPILYGYVSKNSVTSSEKYVVKSQVTYQCDEGFWFNSTAFSKEITCQANGQWSVDLDNLGCIRVVCDDPPDVPNGYYVSSGLTFTHTARFFCDDGYTAGSESILTCSATGKWSPTGEDLVCEAADCGGFPYIPNAVASSLNTSTVFGANITYKCLPQYYFSAGVDSAVLFCGQDGKWMNSNIKCTNVADFECDFPPQDDQTYYTRSTSRKVNMHCIPGYGMTIPGKESVETTSLTCNGSGIWTPVDVKCEEMKCDFPSITGPHRVVGQTDRSKKFPFSTVLDVRCSSGYVLSPPDTAAPKIWSVTKKLVCGQLGQWLPSLETLHCKETDCGTPPDVHNAETSYSDTELWSEAQYKCKPNMSFGNRTILTVTCTEDGRWRPNLATLSCSYRKCTPPPPPAFSTLSVVSYNHIKDAYKSLPQIMRISCISGYNIAPFQFSSEHTCNETGQWNPDPTGVTCTRVHCLKPNVTFLLDVFDYEAKEYRHGHKLTYNCPEKRWFSPHNVTKQVVECWWDGTWKPNLANVRCVDILCDNPPAMHNAVLEGSGVIVGSQWFYTCMPGYRISVGVTSQKIKCLSNGQWLPRPIYQFTCKVIACPTPPIVPNMINGTLAGIKTGHVSTVFYGGVTFTYSCLAGFWISDGAEKVTSKNITCDTGTWKPDPFKTVHCVTVVCDKVARVAGARSDGVWNVYRSRVNYTCAHGQHFSAQKRRRVEVTCEKDGKWRPEPSSLSCTDVKCTDVDLPKAHKLIDSFVMGGKGVFSHNFCSGLFVVDKSCQGITSSSFSVPAFSDYKICPPTMWFETNLTRIAARCSEDGRWVPRVEGRKCQVVDCGKPNLEHVLLQHDNFEYKTQVELACVAGYTLTPTTSTPPTTMCDMSGVWYPSPSFFTCKPVQCPLPRYVPNAVIQGSGLYNTTFKIKCEPGYFIRRGTSEVEIECLHDTTWGENVNAVQCYPFQCSSPRQMLHANLVMSRDVPAYNSRIDYRCARGYWIAVKNYSRRVVCNDKGMWDPPVNFQCEAIKCKYPFKKQHSSIDLNGSPNISLYDVDQTLKFQCDDYHWLTVQYDLMEWAFTDQARIQLVCAITGSWRPHLDSFECRSIEEGALPVGYVRGLDAEEVKAASWLQNEQMLKANFSSHPYLTATPLGDARWINGKSLRTAIIRGGSPAQPGHPVVNVWDGNDETSWKPNVTGTRVYTFTLYLADHYQVNALEIHSGTGKQDQVVDMKAEFSPEGKNFRNSMRFSFKNVPGRSAIESTSVDEIKSIPVARGQKWIAEIPSFFAKFVHITILSTGHLDRPPVVYDFQLLVIPVRWEIIYSPDHQTLPIIAGCIAFLTLIWGFYAFAKDRLDKQTIMFGLDKAFRDKISSADDCYMIKLKGCQLSNISYIVCRLVGDEDKSPVNILALNQKSLLIKSDNLLLITPPLVGRMNRVYIGWVGNEETEMTEPVDLLVKIGQLSPTDRLSGRLDWSLKEKIVIERHGINTCSIGFDEPAKSRTSIFHIVLRNAVSKFFWRVFTNHIVCVTFYNDFVYSFLRLEQVAMATFGCFTAAFIAAILSSLETVFTSLTIYGVACLSSIITLPILFMVYHVLLRHPIKIIAPDELTEKFNLVKTTKSGDLGQGDDLGVALRVGTDKPVVERAGIQGTGDSDVALLPSKEESYSYQPTETEEKMNNNLLKLIDDIRLMDKAERPTTPEEPVTKPIPSVTDTQDSCLLPAEYRMRGPFSFGIDTHDIRTIDLDDAYKLRLSRLPRRTRSSPAIMDLAAQEIKGASSLSSSLPNLSVLTEDLSCASLWSRNEIIRAWHKVHTSVRQPIFDLFQSPERPGFFWDDPTYRRIPSDFDVQKPRRLSLPDPKIKQTKSVPALSPKQAPETHMEPLKIASEETLSAVEKISEGQVGIVESTTNTALSTSSEADLSKIPSFHGRLRVRQYSYRQNKDDGDAILRHRTNKKIVAFSDQAARPDSPDVGLFPSAGQRLAKFRKQKEAVMDSIAEESVEPYNAAVPAVPSTIEIANSSDVIKATSVAGLLRVPVTRKIFLVSMWCLPLCGIILSTALGITTIDETTVVLYSCVSAIVLYLTLVLFLESVIRVLFMKDKERFSLAEVFSCEIDDVLSTEGENQLSA